MPFARSSTSASPSCGSSGLAEVWTENPRAQRSYEKAGFTQEATFRHDRWEGGRYTDGHVMSILRDEWQSRRS